MRYALVVTGDDGGSEAFGTFQRERAWSLFEQAHDEAHRINLEEGSNLSVELHPLKRWPGIRAFRRQLNAGAVVQVHRNEGDLIDTNEEE